ncbi:hypothetical protein CSW24_04295, partial [Thermus scotoductus]
MSLDDLLGLLFLLFFIVIPALQGLSRRGQPPPIPPGFPEDLPLSLISISEPTRPAKNSHAVCCMKIKNLQPHNTHILIQHIDQHIN